MSEIPCFELGLDMLSDTLFSESFDIFCENIDELNRLLGQQPFSEKVVNHNKTLKKSASEIYHNTIDTTGNIVGAYNNITDANASVIKSFWDVLMRAIQLATKLIRFISEKVAHLPKFISNTARKVLRIAPNIKNKISGDISLYISAEDIGSLYNSDLFNMIDQFLTLASTLAKGDFWGSMLHKRKDDTAGKKNDMKICRQMQVIYEKLQRVEFHQTTISMKDKRNVDIYFGDSKSITFKDLSRNEYNCTYYEALLKLMEDINAQQDKLREVDKALGEKYDRTKANQSFGSLNLGAQRMVVDSLQQTAKVITVLANVVKCVMSDIKSIENSIEVITAKQGVQADKEAVKEAQKAAAAANKPEKEKKSKDKKN